MDTNQTNRVTQRVLVTDIGRIVGVIPSTDISVGTRIEYGWRDKDGIKHIDGIATVRRKRICMIDQYQIYDASGARVEVA